MAVSSWCGGVSHSWTHQGAAQWGAGEQSMAPPVAGIRATSPLLVLNIRSLVAQMVKKLPAMQETWVGDSLEKGMATLSSILSWRIPWTEEPGRIQSMGSQRVRYDWATNTHFYTCINKGTCPVENSFHNKYFWGATWSFLISVWISVGFKCL